MARRCVTSFSFSSDCFLLPPFVSHLLGIMTTMTRLTMTIYGTANSVVITHNDMGTTTERIDGNGIVPRVTSVTLGVYHQYY